MNFAWNLAKSNACQISRNFDFAYVISVFTDPNVLSEHDQRWDYGEERFRALGVVEGKVFVVVFTKRQNAIRIILARRAYSPASKRR